MKTSFFLLIGVALSGCATGMTGRQRLTVGAVAGGVAGAAGGAILSPNDQSQSLNALVFGLAGALVGGVGSLLLGPDPEPSRETPSLRDRELGLRDASHKEYVVPQGHLPGFVKDRFKPAVIEEYTEADSLTEDGALRAPHKVYRIRRPAELVPKRRTQTEESKP